MKKMIALATILATTTVCAQELQFGDVNYFLKQGQFNAGADIDQTFKDETNKAGTEVFTRSVLTQAHLGYAFSDKLNFVLGFAYDYDNQQSDKTNEHKSDIYSDGFVNPSIGANYRLLNQGISGLNLDFGAIATVKVQNAKLGVSDNGNDRSGNAANGRNALELNARVGKKWDEANEWQVAAGLKYFKDGETTVKTLPTGDYTRKEDSSIDTYLRTTYQYRPVHEFMLLVSLQANQIGKVSGENDTTNADYKAKSHLDVDFNFQAKYLIMDNFIANFHYGQSHNSDYGVTNNGVNDQVRKRRRNHFGVGVDFLF